MKRLCQGRAVQEKTCSARDTCCGLAGLVWEIVLSTLLLKPPPSSSAGFYQL